MARSPIAGGLLDGLRTGRCTLSASANRTAKGFGSYIYSSIFRFRRSTRLGLLRFNFAKGELSSISVGGRGASLNIPVSRSCGARTTVGLPGTGLPNSRRLRPGQLDALKRTLLEVLHREHGLVSRLLADVFLSARTAGLLALIETPGPAVHRGGATSRKPGRGGRGVLTPEREMGL